MIRNGYSISSCLPASVNPETGILAIFGHELVLRACLVLPSTLQKDLREIRPFLGLHHDALDCVSNGNFLDYD